MESIEAFANAIALMLCAWNAGYNFYFDAQQFSDSLEAYVINKSPKE